jgi:predicted dehydrogenase
LPNNLHKPLAIKALKAGKHVLCEKPLAMSYIEAQEMFDVAKENQRLLVEAIWFRWHPRTIKALQVITAGQIGEALKVDATFTFQNNTLSNYRFDPLQGGGALLDLGPYLLHLLAALAGVDSAISLHDLQQNMGDSGVDLTTTVKGVCGDNLAFNFHLSFEQDPKQEISITGSNGQLSFGMSDAFTNWKAASSMKVNSSTDDFAAVDPYQLMVEAVSDSIAGVKSWLPSADQSLFVMSALDQIRTGKRSG